MAKSCCNNCAPAVTQLVGPARVPTGKRRPFAASAKPNSMTATSCNDYRMAIAHSSLHADLPLQQGRCRGCPKLHEVNSGTN
jgi:hypothetical protein